jgi:hypothetical protein
MPVPVPHRSTGVRPAGSCREGGLRGFPPLIRPRRGESDSGSFGSPPQHGIDGGSAVFREVFEALDRLEAKSPNDGQHGIAQGGKYLRRMTGVRSCLIFPAGDVTNVMQFVFNAPVLARQFQQTRRPGLRGGQAGDRVHRLNAFLAPDDALAGQAADLAQTWPGGCQVLGHTGGRLQAARFDSTMAFFDRLGLLEVRCRRPFRRGRLRRESQCDIRFQRRLIVLDSEKVVAAAFDDEAASLSG